MAEDSEDNTENFILEYLKAIRASQERVETEVGDLKQGQIRIRNDINDLRGDNLRLERMIAEIGVRVERIEKRLDLVEA